jgi:hypothetical protein
MIEMLKRHEIQVLRRAGHTWAQVAELAGVSVRTSRRVTVEDCVVAEARLRSDERFHMARSMHSAREEEEYHD